MVPYIFSLKINPLKTKDISLNDNYRATNFCFDI